MLARLDYAALAKGFGVAYQEIDSDQDCEAAIRGALECAGPVLTRVVTDYGNRPLRWVNAARDRFTKELTMEQKARFLARLGARSLDLRPRND
jgi:acetolactate synthase-1/2/3 large subunit